MKKRLSTLTSLLLCAALTLTMPANTMMAEEMDFSEEYLFTEEIESSVEKEWTGAESSAEEETEPEISSKEEESIVSEEDFPETEIPSEADDDMDFLSEEQIALASDIMTLVYSGATRASFAGDAQSNSMNPEELFTHFANRELGLDDGIATVQSYCGDLLVGRERKIYDNLCSFLDDVARGYRKNTSYTVPMSALGLPTRLYGSDLHIGKITSRPEYGTTTYNNLQDTVADYLNFDPLKVAWAVYYDYPLEFYWLNYFFWYTDVRNFDIGYDSSRKEYYVLYKLSYDFEVNAAFRGSSIYEVNISRATQLRNALNHVNRIIENAAALPDLEKLIRYRDTIISMTDYDYEALYDLSNYGYGYGLDGNPWQLINVFDGDPNTMVVCEGYEKAFKYLCDRTSFFSPEIECYTCIGNMSGLYFSGEHAWNIVHMGAGKNYLVDITNCDGGGDYVNPNLFMAVPIRGDYKNGYYFWDDGLEYRYKYNDTTQSVCSKEQLTLAQTPYVMLPAPVLSSITNSKLGVTIKWESVEGTELYRVFRKIPGGSWQKIAQTSSLSYVDKTAESGKTYSYTVRCVNPTGSYYTSTYNTTGLSTLFISAPVLAGVSNGTDHVLFKWNASAGATYYTVYRKEGSGSYKKLATVTDTSYKDTTAISGHTYTYTARCVDEAGKSISSYDSVGITVSYIQAPVLLSASPVSSGIQITWAPSDGAEKYRVFRKVSGGSWTKLADTAATTYIDSTGAAGQTYSYTVRCINATGKAYTSNYNTKGLSIAYSSIPVLVSVSNAATGVTLKWNAAVTAEKYRVFRKVPGGSWTRVGDTTSLSYTDKTAVSGETYAYTVRGMNSTGKTYTTIYNTQGLTITYIAAPVLSSISNSLTGVKLTWQPSAGAEKYRVFRKFPGGSWTRVGDTTATQFIDSTIESGDTCIYSVRCIDSLGKTYTSSYDTKGLTIIFIVAPVIDSLTKEAGGVRVTWYPCRGAGNYRIFRKVPGGSWTRIGDSTSTSFTDKNVEDGTTYSYTVRCIDSTGKTYISSYNTTGTSIDY